MATDLFNRTSDQFGGAFPADKAVVQFPGVTGGNSGLVVQQLQLGYAQRLSKIFEVGRNRFYYVGGRADGTLSLQTVLGPKAITAAFFQSYGDMCRADKNALSFVMKGGCNLKGGQPAAAGASETVTINNQAIVLNQISVGVSAQDMLISSSVAGMFGAMTYKVT